VPARRHVPPYPLVSATLLGPLAVAPEHQGQGVGGLLLADAVQRACVSASSVGSSMLVVDAISEQAAAFCEAHSFVRLPECLRLVLPMRAHRKAVHASSWPNTALTPKMNSFLGRGRAARKSTSFPTE
jgi:GNAT superfamily N-acetyltransferase